jgi:Serine dehydrogenase proteinase
MPTWGEILQELGESARQRGGAPDFDGIRRKYLQQLHQRTSRSTIIYYTDWFNISGEQTMITLEDMQAMMEVCKGLRGPSLDLILHSPGGQAEATNSIVRYLRTKFTDIRVFIPLAAMSAATMWALAGDRLVMGRHSQLGPIDPQLGSPTGLAPARAIIQQFERAKEECKDPSVLPAWMPILQQYGPALLQQCEVAEALSRRLVGEWLSKYMFTGQADADQKAERVARFFADYDTHQSHGLGIDRDQARSVGVVVDDLEDDPDLQDAVLSVHHAAMHTMQGPAIKIVENHLGTAFVKVAQQVSIQMPVQPSAPPPAAPPVPQPQSPSSGP